MFSQFRMSHVLYFIFICYVFTDSPSYRYSKELILKRSCSLHILILLRQKVNYNCRNKAPGKIFEPEWDNITEIHVQMLLTRTRCNVEFRRENYI
jgi:hypothetical protein